MVTKVKHFTCVTLMYVALHTDLAKTCPDTASFVNTAHIKSTYLFNTSFCQNNILLEGYHDHYLGNS